MESPTVKSFNPDDSCRGKPCDDAARCLSAGRCCYKSSADESREAMALTCDKTMCGQLGCTDCYPKQPISVTVRHGEQKELDAMHEAAKERVTAKPLPPTILHEALEITGNGGERNDSYDHPYPNFEKIATGWEVLFGVPITPRQVALAMIWMKTVRDNHRGKRDNLVDIAGYARCIERLEEWQDDSAE